VRRLEAAVEEQKRWVLNEHMSMLEKEHKALNEKLREHQEECQAYKKQLEEREEAERRECEASMRKPKEHETNAKG
jgi:hypothetical protein